MLSGRISCHAAARLSDSVCLPVALDTNTAASDYIQLCAGVKDTLAASLKRIQNTSTRIISAILDDRQLDAPR